MSREQEPLTKQDKDLRNMSGEHGPVTVEDIREEIQKLVTRGHRNGVRVDSERHELRSAASNVSDWDVDSWELYR